MKKFYIILVLAAFMCLLPLNANAAELDSENLEQSVKEELFSAIDDDVLSVLEDMGISEGSFREIYNFSLSNITDFFSTTLKDKAVKCLKNSFLLLSVVMITGIISSLFVGNANENFISQMSVVIITVLMINIIGESLSAAVSVLRLSGNFMLSFAPIYTLIISFAGNAASALTYNSLIMIFAEALSAVISYAAADLIGVFFCLSIAFSLNESVNTGRFISAVNKTVSLILGLVAGLFTGFLSIKNVLCVSLDSVSVKSIRFLISSLIPIVGSSISDAYSSLIGSINLIKGSAAFVGILVIVIINLPVILETLIYYFCFNTLSYVSDSISFTRAGETLRCFSCGVRILLLLLVFEMFILIISTGIMLSVKGTA